VIETAGGWNVTSNAMSVFRALSAVPRSVEKEGAKGIKGIGAKILRAAKENAPVETGALRRSGRLESLSGIGTKFVQLIISFGGKGTGVDYAQFVELGTATQKGQFYLIKAVRKYSKELLPFSSKAFLSIWNKEARISNLKRLT
jgi:HK97 gp10 family phage protein